MKSVHHETTTTGATPASGLDSIEITAITDPNARLNALLAGSVDMVAIIQARDIDKVEQSGNKVLSIPSGLYGGICCLKNTAPGSNDDFVQGLRYIQDRERALCASSCAVRAPWVMITDQYLLRGGSLQRAAADSVRP